MDNLTERFHKALWGEPTASSSSEASTSRFYTDSTSLEEDYQRRYPEGRPSHSRYNQPATGPTRVPLNRLYRGTPPTEGTELAKEEMELSPNFGADLYPPDTSLSSFELIPQHRSSDPRTERQENGQDALAFYEDRTRSQAGTSSKASASHYQNKQKNYQGNQSDDEITPSSSPEFKKFLKKYFKPKQSPNSNQKPNSSSQDQKSTSEETGKAMKGKLKAAWNNVKYGWHWKMKSSFDDESPIWLLGNFYHARSVSPEMQHVFERDLGQSENLEPDQKDFAEDFTSRLWFTYRTGFEKFPGTDVDSDCGWGCMLRSGQMMLAQGLVLHLLGRDWKVTKPQSYDTIRAHRNIIRYFGDSSAAPLSLHQMVELGRSHHEKSIGDWYGPGSTALIMRDALLRGAQSDEILDQIAVYVARDCAISLEEIDRVCTGLPLETPGSTVSKQGCSISPDPSGFYKVETENLVGSSAPINLSDSEDDFDSLEPLENGPWSKSLILVIPLRLGADKLNPDYVPHLRTVLALQNCIGIMGGKRKHSMYFVGWHGEHLIYLDPHCAQEAEDTNSPAFSIKSFHCRWPRKLDFADMEPSCSVGFYCRDRKDFYRLLLDLSQVVDSGNNTVPSRHPLFSVLKSFESLSIPYNPRRYSNPEELAQSRATALQHGFELL